MDFVFYCASCGGPLIARTNLRGLSVQCAHCSGGTEIRRGKSVTEAVVSELLDAPLPPANADQRILRRVRPAARHSSAGASQGKHPLPRTARISRTP